MQPNATNGCVKETAGFFTKIQMNVLMEIDFTSTERREGFCWDKIAAIAAKKGLSQEAVAKELGISRQAVSKWETDLAQPDLDNLKKICDAVYGESCFVGYVAWQRSYSMRNDS